MICVPKTKKKFGETLLSVLTVSIRQNIAVTGSAIKYAIWRKKPITGTGFDLNRQIVKLILLKSSVYSAV